MPDTDSLRHDYPCPGTGCNRVFPSRKGLTSHQRYCTFCNSEESDEELGEPLCGGQMLPLCLLSASMGME